MKLLIEGVDDAEMHGAQVLLLTDFGWRTFLVHALPDDDASGCDVELIEHQTQRFPVSD